jgi:hypothetical protein
MDPKILSGQWCVFYHYKDDAGTRNGAIVLVQDREQEWIRLFPINKDGYNVIELNSGGNYEVIGVFVDAVNELEFVEQPRYERIVDEWL